MTWQVINPDNTIAASGGSEFGGGTWDMDPKPCGIPSVVINLLNTTAKTGINRIMRPSFRGFVGVPSLAYTITDVDVAARSTPPATAYSLNPRVDARGPSIEPTFDSSKAPGWAPVGNTAGFTFRATATDAAGNVASTTVHVYEYTDKGIYGPPPSCIPR